MLLQPGAGFLGNQGPLALVVGVDFPQEEEGEQSTDDAMLIFGAMLQRKGVDQVLSAGEVLERLAVGDAVVDHFNEGA